MSSTVPTNGDKSRCSPIRSASQQIAGILDVVLDTDLGPATSHALSLDQPLAPDLARDAAAEFQASFDAWIAHGRRLIQHGYYCRDVAEHYLAEIPLPERPAFLDDPDAELSGDIDWDAPLDGFEAPATADLEWSALTADEQAAVLASNPEPAALVKIASGELVQVPPTS